MSELITETQAQELAGLSLETLSRFVETGYLKVERSSDGIKSFKRSELEKLFGISSSSLNRNIVKSSPPDKKADHNADQTTDKKTTIEKLVVNTPEVVEDQNIHQNKSVSSDHKPDKVTKLSRVHEIHENDLPENHSNEELERELIRLRGALELHSTLLAVREQEIKELKQQRSWFEQRLEKAEQLHQREQVLLLAESETVRRLVHNNSRSPLKLALEWLGLGSDSDSSTNNKK